jgi:hypothetical protein
MFALEHFSYLLTASIEEIDDEHIRKKVSFQKVDVDNNS